MHCSKEWDRYFGSSFLGNFYHLGEKALEVELGGKKNTFENAEAAFQALKFKDTILQSTLWGCVWINFYLLCFFQSLPRKGQCSSVWNIGWRCCFQIEAKFGRHWTADLAPFVFKPGGSSYAAGQEDWTYAGFGNNWLGMWHILEKKFAPDSDLVFWRISQNVRMKTTLLKGKPHAGI